ncbi:uncharacterized protein YkwD [Jatrophihabitans sp. GAS493]|uniref:CAP domain-containing protein n=1 Tax=Jatrophihabitans sp. GAS493 TaxID=1907575 RepID=UPI000BBFA27C|nr:CAP domain-containing protein [Jatrophihabitans sp. GAS493]SOD73381.1 uncharacterized protein YkwD [Jatrophihabitans sp. GAS493]
MTRNVTDRPRFARSRRAVVSMLLIGATVLGLSALTNSASAASVRRPDIANAMLKLMNAQRKAHHLAPLKMNTKLISSAYAHDKAMATRNTMSHQVQSEASFAQRIKAVKYNFRAAGENIGWSTNASAKGVLALQTYMYNEKAPANGHRLNILSSTYREVGIDVMVDAHTGKVWFTEDFGRAR